MHSCMMPDVVGLVFVVITGSTGETDVPNGLCGFVGWHEGATNDSSRLTRYKQPISEQYVSTATARFVEVGAFRGGTFWGNVALILSWMVRRC